MAAKEVKNKIGNFYGKQTFVEKVKEASPWQ
jgi:hypothetical protein